MSLTPNLTQSPVLYIVMRKDIPDMNPGKGMAQAAHAQAEFAANIALHHDMSDKYDEWKEDRAFGTTIVLHETMEMMHGISCMVVSDYHAMVTDPTYPWRNHYGDLFLDEEVTCMWIFATTQETFEIMKDYKLHP